MPNYASFCGWIEDQPGIRAYAMRVGAIQQVAGHLIGSGSGEEVQLWRPLLRVKPSWKRGAQGIGDCVSWGSEIVCTALLAIQDQLGTSTFTEEAATETIYGGCRVEALGKRRGGWMDGAFGYAAARWVNQFGVLLRADYSRLTGNSEHDVRVYDKDKAKNWGNFGNGGQNDNDELDSVARETPVRNTAQVTKIDELISSVANGYPVTIASDAGYGDMRRNEDGVVFRHGRPWPHQMAVLGNKWINGKYHGRIVQSWGHSCSGPDPGIDDPEISKCSWWSTEEDLAYILRTGDCWSHADVEGFPARKIDWAKATEALG